MKHNRRAGGAGRLALAALLLGLGLAGCGGESGAKTYSERVYVSDHLFVTAQESADALPRGYACVGRVEKRLGQNEPVEENGVSNSLDIGCELYLDPAADLDDMESPVRLYAALPDESSYKIFLLMHAVG